MQEVTAAILACEAGLSDYRAEVEGRGGDFAETLASIREQIDAGEDKGLQFYRELRGLLDGGRVAQAGASSSGGSSSSPGTGTRRTAAGLLDAAVKAALADNGGTEPDPDENDLDPEATGDAEDG